MGGSTVTAVNERSKFYKAFADTACNRGSNASACLRVVRGLGWPAGWVSYLVGVDWIRV